jgi:hypothetical protein
LLLPPGPPRRMKPPMNADGFRRLASFRLRIERRVTDNLFILIELFADGL